MKDACKIYTDKKGREYTRHYEKNGDEAARIAADLVTMCERGKITPLETLGYAVAVIGRIIYKMNKKSEIADIAALIGAIEDRPAEDFDGKDVDVAFAEFLDDAIADAADEGGEDE